jgi:hypothetical protein
MLLTWIDPCGEDHHRGHFLTIFPQGELHKNIELISVNLQIELSTILYLALKYKG